MFYIARLSVVMLSIIYPGCHALYCQAECSYAERHLSLVSHFLYYHSECHYAECHYAECHYVECHYVECHYVECHCAECRGTMN